VQDFSPFNRNRWVDVVYRTARRGGMINARALSLRALRAAALRAGGAALRSPMSAAPSALTAALAALPLPPSPPAGTRS
jgi:16S rRNA C1402 (ribose-2'-O) methylase RsmI